MCIGGDEPLSAGERPHLRQHAKVDFALLPARVIALSSLCSFIFIQTGERCPSDD